MWHVVQAFEKYEKQLKAAKSGGGKDAKAKAEKVTNNATKTNVSGDPALRRLAPWCLVWLALRCRAVP